jgi:hypothetical protein
LQPQGPEHGAVNRLPENEGVEEEVKKPEIVKPAPPKPEDDLIEKG